MASNVPARSEAAASSNSYALHIFPFSLYSIIARFTYALGRKSASNTGNGGVKIENKLVNLHRDENIAEEYLLMVNPKGQVCNTPLCPSMLTRDELQLRQSRQVPALTGGSLPSPLTDSLDISYWLCIYYPHLLPAVHESTIRSMLSQLHDIQALSLTIRKEYWADGVPAPSVDALLSKTDISTAYRHALEFKRNLWVYLLFWGGSRVKKRKYSRLTSITSHRETQEKALEEDRILLAEDKARRFFADLLKLYQAHGDESP